MVRASAQPAEAWRALREQVLQSTEWLTVDALQRRSSSAVGLLALTQWRTFGIVFALELDDCMEVFPAYAFDPRRGYQPRPVMRAVHSHLFMRQKSLGLAAWYASPNSDLGHQRPLDLVASAPDRVLTAARNVYGDARSGLLSMEERAIYRAAGRDLRYGSEI